MISRRSMMAGCGATLALSGCLEPAPEPPEFPDIDYGARRDGGHVIPAVPMEEIPASLHRQVVAFDSDAAPGSIVIRADQRVLHFVLEDGFALRYGIGIGRIGLGWTGTAEVYRKQRWPSWTPTEDMIRRDSSLERWADGQPGGPTNPLGARALYLRTVPGGRDEGIRIHGTPEWRSIGRAASSGCFRMIQQEVLDLYDRVPIGSRVIVTDAARA